MSNKKLDTFISWPPQLSRWLGEDR